MLIALVTPLIAVAVGVIFLSEEVTWRLLAGGLCIIFGIALINLRRRRGGLSGPLVTRGAEPDDDGEIAAVRAKLLE
jgi:hypothetical protein